MIAPTPAAVVEAFVKATLGTVPGAAIDYDRARSLMTGAYAPQVDSQAFAPTAYGIQEGPTAYDISSEEVAGTRATVVVGHWGGESGRRWGPVLSQQAGAWKVTAIDGVPISHGDSGVGTEVTLTEPLLGEWQTSEDELSDRGDQFRILQEPDGRLRIRWVDEHTGD